MLVFKIFNMKYQFSNKTSIHPKSLIVDGELSYAGFSYFIKTLGNHINKRRANICILLTLSMITTGYWYKLLCEEFVLNVDVHKDQYPLLFIWYLMHCHMRLDQGAYRNYYMLTIVRLSRVLKPICKQVAVTRKIIVI